MNFETAFRTLTGFPPFLWQRRLFDQYFSKGETPAALDLPTGLGKTSVMAIWLAARALGGADTQKRLPRRLVYVVDRRAVVDQATAEAEKLREALEGAASELKAGLGLADRSLPISTLRGQFADNREWLADPAAPAIIIGTVDMMGSRLLFEGYGVSRKMRPYHAGLLGADALIVLDEAHLVPPFEKLIEAIETGAATDHDVDRPHALGPRSADDRKIIPALRLLSLSATGRERGGEVFRLTEDDRKDDVVKRRLEARKAISVKSLKGEEKLEDALAKAAWELAENGAAPIRCLIYCDKRETAQKVCEALSNRAKPATKDEPKKAEVELFTGARRFFEREKTAEKLRRPLGFIAGNKNETGKPAFLVATSAAEVGVDLDADHMVCDLVAWERMVQRFGRVNRRGEGDAKIIIIDAGEPAPKKTDEPTEAEQRTMRAYNSLAVIKQLRTTASGDFDARPAGLLDLKVRAATDETLRAAIDVATTPAPLRPALTRALIDAWSMTSLEKHAGRPEVGPWLRGWVDEDRPQPAIVWRGRLPVRESGEKPTDKEVEEFFEAAPPHVSEKLEMETYAVADWLMKRAAEILKSAKAGSHTPDANDGVSSEPVSEDSDEKAPAEMPKRVLRANDIVAFALSPARELKKSYRLNDFDDDKKRKDALERELAGVVLILDARFCGLSDGLLDHTASGVVRAVDDGGEWLWEEKPEAGKTGVPLVKFRVRIDKDGDEVDEQDARDRPSPPDWHKPFKFALRLDGEGNAVRSLIVEKWRGATTKEDERSVSRPQSLVEHQSWAADKVTAIAQGVGLDDNLAKALAVAARLHDEGKRAKRWQRAFNAHKSDKALDRPLAKTKGPIDFNLLDGYRHEFGSLPFAEKDEEFQSLPGETKDLVLHVIASHHGGARPVIGTRGCDDAPPSALAERARDVALRFARLQKQWGPWGLAWLEALLRAADAQASRENDERERRATIDQPADEVERT